MDTLSPDESMSALLARFPSARRTLFAEFHIGGCQSCAFDDSDSLAQVCQQHDIEVSQATAAILESHERESQFLITPQELAQLLKSTSPPPLVDTRTREEHEAVKIPNSELLTESTLNQFTQNPPELGPILYDHTGTSVLDHLSWFVGHGLKGTRALKGALTPTLPKSIPPSSAIAWKSVNFFFSDSTTLLNQIQVSLMNLVQEQQ